MKKFFTQEQEEFLHAVYGKAIIQKANIIAAALNAMHKNKANVFSLSQILKGQEHLKSLWLIHIQTMVNAGILQKLERGLYVVTDLGKFWYNQIIELLKYAQGFDLEHIPEPETPSDQLLMQE